MPFRTQVGITEYIQHRQKAVIYARESGDQTLLVTCLEYLSNAFYHTRQIARSLDTYLEVEHESKNTEIPGFLRSRVQSGLSLPCAHQGKSEEVIRLIDGAYTTLTEPDAETPVFLRVTNGRFITILDEGRSILNLGNHAQDQGFSDRAQKYWKGAAEKLGRIEQLPSGLPVSVGMVAEKVIVQALAYAKAGDMERFLTAFKKGAKLAKDLGSERRKQEAKEALKEALEQWRNNQQITGLWELL